MKALICVLLLCCCSLSAHATSAGDLLASCVKSNTATNAKGKYDAKRPDDIYKAGQCSGFIQGWMEGLDGSFLTNSATGSTHFVAIYIKWNEVTDVWKIAAALQKDLNDNPLDSGKPADEILRKILVEGGLIEERPSVVSSDAVSTTSQSQ